MRSASSSFRRRAIIALVVAGTVAVGVAIPTLGGKPPHSATTTLPPEASTGLIAVGPSRSRCLEPAFVDTGLSALQAAVTHFENQTDSVVTCVSAYLDSAATWGAWVHPWVADSIYGYSSWVAEEPRRRQLILGVNLIPNDLANIKDPLSWERSCAAGHFDSYATQLGATLVHAGLKNSVLRLGPEMNGKWENDYVGDTSQEQNLWASCFAKEVTALRHVTGEHFLIDWNPNACVENIPYLHFYPGNAYVDILGLDLFDQSCVAPNTPYTFQQLANEPASLTKFEAFAAATKKPMSFPEWGYLYGPIKDDPGYFNGIGTTVAHRDFAFESYYDYQKPHPRLGPNTPLSLAAFRRWFGVVIPRRSFDHHPRTTRY